MTGYQRQLGTLDAIMIISGAVIGAGIFLAPPGVAKSAGSVELTLGVWMLGGIITAAGGFCFAELGARFPHAGGSYVYLREGFGRAAAFVQGWALLAVSGAGAVAAVSLFCAGQIAETLGSSEGARPLIATVSIAGAMVINCLGLRPGATTQNVLTTLKILLLVLVTVAGFKAAAGGPAVAAAAPGEFSWVGLLGSLVPVIFAYNGWQMIGFVAGEIDDAPRRLPRALLGSILCLMALYLAVNVAYIAGLGFTGLAASRFPGSAVMERAFGAAGGTFMRVGTIISTLGFVNVSILTLPRVLQAMAADGMFFRSFAELHPTHRTPVRAIVLQSIWAMVLVFTGKAEDLLAYVVFSDGLFMALGAGALFRIRRRETPKEAVAQPYLAPGYPWLPVLYVLASVGVMASAIALKPREALVGAAIIAGGLPLYFLWGNRATDGT